MSILNLSALFKTHRGNIHNAIASLGDTTQYTEIKTSFDVTGQERNNLGEFSVAIVCQILNSPNHKLEKVNLSGGSFKVPYEKIKELAEAVANATNPPQILIKNKGKNLYETLAQFIVLNHLHFKIDAIAAIKNAGVDLSIGECNSEYEPVGSTVNSLLDSYVKKESLFNRIVALSQTLGNYIAYEYPNGNKKTLTAYILEKHPKHFHKILKKLEEKGFDTHIAIEFANGNKQTIASYILDKYPDDFHEKLKKLEEIGSNTITSFYSSNGQKESVHQKILRRQKSTRSIIVDNYELTPLGTHYFATNQNDNSKVYHIGRQNSKIKFNQNSPIFVSKKGTEEEKTYTFEDFENLDKDFKPFLALVESGFLEKFSLKVQDVLKPEILEKIRQNFLPFLTEYCQRKYDQINLDGVINILAKNFLPKGMPEPFIDEKLNPELEELIPSITKKHQIIRSQISELYRQIENEFKNNLDVDTLNEFETKAKEDKTRLEKQFIDHFLIETSGCELSFGEDEFNKALEIAKNKNFKLSLNLAKEIANSFVNDTKQEVAMQIDDQKDFEFSDYKKEDIKIHSTSEVVSLVQDEIYRLLAAKNYHELSLLQRLEQDEDSSYLKIKNPDSYQKMERSFWLESGKNKMDISTKKETWLSHFTDNLGNTNLSIHKEKLLDQLKNLPNEKLKPLLGFSMKSAEQLADFIKEHSKENSQMVSENMAASPTASSKRKELPQEDNIQATKKNRTNELSMRN